MPGSQNPAVTAERPDSSISIQGTDHVTLEGTNTDDTIEFYRDILGMALVLSQPNLDRKHLTHLLFDAGDGRLVSFFVNEERNSTDLRDPDPGHVHHMAFRIDADQIGDTADALAEHGYPVSEYDRGAFHSLYTEDHNGLTIELVADKFSVPDELRGEVLALAQEFRVEDGAEFVASKHMREAIDQLDIDVEERDIRNASAGQEY